MGHNKDRFFVISVCLSRDMFNFDFFKGCFRSSILGLRPPSRRPSAPKYCKNKFMNKHITYSRYAYSTLKYYTYSRYSKSYLERPSYGV